MSGKRDDDLVAGFCWQSIREGSAASKHSNPKWDVNGKIEGGSGVGGSRKIQEMLRSDHWKSLLGPHLSLGIVEGSSSLACWASLVVSPNGPLSELTLHLLKHSLGPLSPSLWPRHLSGLTTGLSLMELSCTDSCVVLGSTQTWVHILALPGSGFIVCNMD